MSSVKHNVFFPQLVAVVGQSLPACWQHASRCTHELPAQLCVLEIDEVSKRAGYSLNHGALARQRLVVRHPLQSAASLCCAEPLRQQPITRGCAALQACARQPRPGDLLAPFVFPESSQGGMLSDGSCLLPHATHSHRAGFGGPSLWVPKSANREMHDCASSAWPPCGMSRLLMGMRCRRLMVRTAWLLRPMAPATRCHLWEALARRGPWQPPSTRTS
jgi:hypothetical protein